MIVPDLGMIVPNLGMLQNLVSSRQVPMFCIVHFPGWFTLREQRENLNVSQKHTRICDNPPTVTS